MVGQKIMGRKRSQGFAEDIGQLIVGLLVLGALSGGIAGFSERLRGLFSLLIGAIVVVSATIAVVCLVKWWLRSSANPASPPPGDTETTRPPLETTEPLVHEPEPKDWSSRLRSMDWYQFEKLNAEILRSEGWTVERRGGASPDGGVDLIAMKGETRALVQCKHWRNWNVQEKVIREMLGSMTHFGVSSGAIHTLKGWTAPAARFASEHSIALSGSDDLARRAYENLSKDDLDRWLLDETHHCPKCEALMIWRTGDFEPFWGCSRFPVCRAVIRGNSG